MADPKPEESKGGPAPLSPGWRASVLAVGAAMGAAELAGLSTFLDGRPLGTVGLLRLLGVLGGTLAWVGFSWSRVRPLLRSLKFGITVLTFLLFASILGTLFAQRSGEEEGSFKSTFLQAEAEFLWNLSHPLARFASPPRERAALIAWLRERGVARPEAVTEGMLLGPDLEAQERIFGKRAARETWKRQRSRILQAVQEAGVRAHLAAHRGFYQGLYEIAESLEFTALWKSDWFAALVILLVVSMGLNLARPGRITWRKLGFWGAHGGVILAVIGAAVGRRYEVRGSLPLRVGETADRFWSQRPDPGLEGRSRFRDDLALRLAAFRALPHYRLQAAVMAGPELAGLLPQGIRIGGYIRSLKIHEGAGFALLPGKDGSPRWRVVMERFLPRVRLRRIWKEVPPEDPEALAAALLSRRDPRSGKVLEEKLLSVRLGGAAQEVLPGGRRLVLVSCRDEACLEAWKKGEGLGRYGRLRLMGKDGKWVEIPLEEGARTRLETREGRLEVLVLRVMQKFDLETWGGRKGIFGDSLEKFPGKVDPAPDREKNRSLPPLNPAAALVVRGPKGVGGLYVFSRGGHMDGMKAMPVPGKAVYTSIRASLLFDEIRSPARERAILLAGPKEAFLVRTAAGKVIDVKPLKAGAEFGLGRETWRVDRFHRSARFRWDVEPLPEKGRRYMDDPAALELRVEGPSGVKTFTLVSTTVTMEREGRRSPLEKAQYDRNLLFRMVENRAMPQEWWSRLQVYRLKTPRGMTRDGLTAVAPVLEADRWKRFLRALKEAGADVTPLEGGGFRDEAGRKARLEELCRALDRILVQKDASFWMERLPADLFVPLSQWVDRGSAARLDQEDIRVNDPLMIPLRGIPPWLCAYQVNQSDARADRPDYSGFQVIWDPGVQVVKLGLVLIALGTVLLFLALPMRRGFTGKEAA